MVKNLPADAGDTRDMGSIPGLRRFPWRRKWQPTPVFLPGKFHGQRSLMGYSPWGCKESDTTECTHIHSGTITDLVLETEMPKKKCGGCGGDCSSSDLATRVHCRCPVNQQSWGEAPWRVLSSKND